MRRRGPTPLAAHAFAAGILVLVVAWWLRARWDWSALWAYVASVNAVTVGFYGYDKLIAGGRRTRVPEAALHVLAFAGGSPGALAAQQLFRHKTRKSAFRVAFWTLVAVQAAVIAAIWWWSTR